MRHKNGLTEKTDENTAYVVMQELVYFQTVIFSLCLKKTVLYFLFLEKNSEVDHENISSWNLKLYF